MKAPAALSLFAPLLLASPMAQAADQAENQSIVLFHDKSDKSLFSFDYGPPTSPALSLIGLSPDKTTTSSSLQKFVLALPSLYGQDANQTVAFDFAPALFAPTDQLTYEKYITGDRLYRLRYRTRIGVAAQNGDRAGGDATKAVRSRLAIGFSSSLLDSADPLKTADGLLDRCLAPYVAPGIAILNNLKDAPAELDVINAERRRINRALRGLDEWGWTPAQAWATWKQAPPPSAPPNPAPAPKPTPSAADELAAMRASFEQMEKSGKLSAEQQSFNAHALALLTLLAPKPAEAPAAPKPEEPPASPAAPADLTKEDLVAQLTGRLADLNEAAKKPDAARVQTLSQRLADAGVTAAVGRCSDMAARMARYSPDLDVGLGYIARGDPGELSGLDKPGGAIWLAYKFPLGAPLFKAPKLDENKADPLPKQVWMVALSGRYGWDEWYATGDKATPEFQGDKLEGWIGLERLTPSTRFAAQYGWQKVTANSAIGKPFQSSGERYLISGQFRLGGDTSPTWLGLSYGNGYGTTDKLKDTVALVTLSFTPPTPPDITAAKQPSPK